MKLKHKICPNCGTVIVYNYETDAYICNICGYDFLNESKDLDKERDYIN